MGKERGKTISYGHQTGKSDRKVYRHDVVFVRYNNPDAAPPFKLQNHIPNYTQWHPTKCPGTFPREEAKRRANNPSICRSLGQIFASQDILSGEEGEKLRNYCNTAYLDIRRDFKDPYDNLFQDGDLAAFQEHFQSRVLHFEGRRHEAAQELFKLRWGPTRTPVYTVLLEFATIELLRRYKYIAIVEWLVDTAKVPVDGMY